MEAGSTFSSYSDFESVLHEYCKENNVLFSIASSQRITTLDPSLSHLKYNYVIFSCKQGGRKHKPTSSGKRPNQTTLKVNCRAKIRINLCIRKSKDENQEAVLKITTCNLEHTNHPVNRQVYSQYPENRRFKVDNFTNNVLNSSNVFKIAELKKMLEEHHKISLKKSDIYNIKRAKKKVKEIKQRQQTWMAQREQSKQKDPGNTKSDNKSTPPQVNKATPSSKSLPASSSRPAITSSTVQKISGRKKIVDTFNNWSKQREIYNVSDEDQDAVSVRSGAESELERLVSPDGEMKKECPVPEEDFGDFAERIAYRVKVTMGLLDSCASDGSLEDPGTVTEILSQTISETDTNKAVQPSNTTPTSSLASHHCLMCKSLMSSSSHTPMMIIPCGHTVCKTCLDRITRCPECHCPLVSSFVNVMLQQVIQEYHSHATSSSLSNASMEAVCKSEEVENQQNRTSYTSQLINLQTRHAVLLQEKTDLVSKQCKLTSQIRHISSQTKSIADQGHEIKKAIADLQDRLTALETHRKEYELKLCDLQNERTETESKITLLTGTLSSLSKELEKVKLLAEGEENL